MTAKNAKSDAFASIQEIIADLHDTGVIDLKTVREFNETALECPSEDTKKLAKQRSG